VKTWFSTRRCVALLCGAAFGVCLAFGSSAARADIIPSLTSITSVSGGFNWTYTVTLSGPQDIEPSVGILGFGTLYDIGPVSFVGSTGLLSSDFSFAFSNTNTPAVGTAAFLACADGRGVPLSIDGFSYLPLMPKFSSLGDLSRDAG
jgi:hypothetical protein